MTLTFDLKIYRAHPCLVGSLHVKFHDERCKKKVVMRRKPFSVIYALWPWPLDLKIYRAHPWLMGSLHVKFHDDRCKGKAVMCRKPKDGRKEGRTDMVIPVYPPNFVGGGGGGGEGGIMKGYGSLIAVIHSLVLTPTLKALPPYLHWFSLSARSDDLHVRSTWNLSMSILVILQWIVIPIWNKRSQDLHIRFTSSP